MQEGYEKAMAKSFSNQLGEMLIPAYKLSHIIEITLGFQPLGIASQGNKIAIAAYYESAICLAEVNRDKEGLRFRVDWIRGVNHGIQSVRLFPDIPQLSGVNRAQTVNFGPDGTLWVSRNGDREFFILSRPTAESAGRWTLTKKFTLPGEGMIHSALIEDGASRLLTIESTMDLEEWGYCVYSMVSNDKVVSIYSQPYFYGLGIGRQGSAMKITDYRAEMPHGIYTVDGDNPVISDIWGNGICFLPDGSALVTKYGQAAPGPFNGDPGSLIYIPAKFFSH